MNSGRVPSCGAAVSPAASAATSSRIVPGQDSRTVHSKRSCGWSHGIRNRNRAFGEGIARPEHPHPRARSGTRRTERRTPLHSVRSESKRPRLGIPSRCLGNRRPARGHAVPPSNPAILYRVQIVQMANGIARTHPDILGWAECGRSERGTVWPDWVAGVRVGCHDVAMPSDDRGFRPRRRWAGGFSRQRSRASSAAAVIGVLREFPSAPS